MVSDLNNGYEIPNIKKLVNVICEVLNINELIHILPLKLTKLNENGYAVRQANLNLLYIKPDILKRDKINTFNKRLFIHELTHIKQYIDGDLKMNENHTKATWKGVDYDNSTPHEDRPFEIEARKNETKLIKEVNKKLKEIK